MYGLTFKINTHSHTALGKENCFLHKKHKKDKKHQYMPISIVLLLVLLFKSSSDE